MSSNLIEYLIAAVTTIVCGLLMFGLPAVAVIVIKYFKLKERELLLKLEAGERTEWSTEERLQRIEDALANLEHALQAQASLQASAPPDVLEPPEEAARAPSGWTKAR